MEPRRQQAQEPAGEAEGHRQNHDEGREQGLELGHHDEVDDEHAQQHQEHQVLHGVHDGLVLPGVLHLAALGQRHVRQGLSSLGGHQCHVVPVRHGGGDGDVAPLLQPVDGGKGLGLGDGDDVLQGHLLGGAVPQRGGDGHLLQLPPVRLPVLRMDGGGERGGAGGDLGGADGAGQLLDDGEVHLGGGQIVLDGLLLVHRDVQGRGGVLRPAGDLPEALHRLEPLRHGLGRHAQVVEIVGIDVHGEAAALEHGAHAHGGYGGHLEVHLPLEGGQDLSDVLRGLDAAVAAVLVHQGVDGDLVPAAPGGQAHQTLHAPVDHAADVGEMGHRFHGGHHLVRHPAPVLEGVLLRHGHGDGDLGAAAFGEVFIALPQGAPGRAPQQRQGQQQGQGPMAQREADRPFKAPHELPGQVAHGLHLPPQQALGHGGDHGEGHDQAGHEGIGDGQDHVHEDLPGHAVDEDDGHEHADGGQRGGGDGPHDLPGPLDGGLLGRHALGPQAVDVLDDHDGVVHQHADPDGQARHGDHVHGDPGEIHEHQCKEHGHGDGDAHGEGGPDVPEEQEQDEDGQRAA